MKLSVALCTYNGAAHLPAQLASLAAQTRRPDELVVRDDGSADDTPGVIRRFAAAAPFPVRVLEDGGANLGTTKNFERVLAACGGDILFPCDQDDVWEPDKLARFGAAFAADPGVGLVASDLAATGPGGEPLGRTVWQNLPCPPPLRAAIEAGWGPDLWLRYNTVTGAAAAFRADLRWLVLPIPGGWVHDAWIAFIAGAVSAVRLIPDPLTRYRTHPGQQIGSAALTLADQVRAARRMDPAYFARTAECFGAAADRLEQFRDRLRDPDLVRRTRAKAAFARTQQRMREGTRLGRVWPVARELAAGHYARYGRGLKGAAADLFL